MYFLDETFRIAAREALAMPEATPAQRADRAVAIQNLVNSKIAGTGAEKLQQILSWDERAGTVLSEDF